MGVSVWWSFIDRYGTERIRRFVAVDQPAAVAAVPWMTEREQRDSGAIFDVSGLLYLGAALAGPEGDTVLADFVRGMFSGEPDPEVLALVAEEIRSTPAYAGVPLLFDHCAQDWRDVLPRIDVPTLVIGCEGSHVHPDSQRFVAERMSKPVFAYVAGFSAPPGKTMGHAGAIISGSSGTAQAKQEALEAVGVAVGTTPTEVAELVARHVRGG